MCLSIGLERFAYFSVTSILVLYAKEPGLDYTDNEAVAIYSYWTAVAYFLPLIVGFLADSYW